MCIHRRNMPYPSTMQQGSYRPRKGALNQASTGDGKFNCRCAGCCRRGHPTNGKAVSRHTFWRHSKATAARTAILDSSRLVSQQGGTRMEESSDDEVDVRLTHYNSGYRIPNSRRRGEISTNLQSLDANIELGSHTYRDDDAVSGEYDFGSMDMDLEDYNPASAGNLGESEVEYIDPSLCGNNQAPQTSPMPFDPSTMTSMSVQELQGIIIGMRYFSTSNGLPSLLGIPSLFCSNASHPFYRPKVFIYSSHPSSCSTSLFYGTCTTSC
jgi:hypothetical protein